MTPLCIAALLIGVVLGVVAAAALWSACALAGRIDEELGIDEESTYGTR